MTKEDKAILALLRIALTGNTRFLDKSSPIDAKVDWAEVINRATEQGVLGVCFDALELLPEGQRPDIDNMMEWLGQTEYQVTTNEAYLKNVKEITGGWIDAGIHVVVLKGLVCSQWYPVPQHRNYGDFDCFLCGDFEKGDEIAKKIGAKVDPFHYKHSHIQYKDLTVENHRFCIGIRGASYRKDFERHLQSLIFNDKNRSVIDGTRLEVPCADFNALFLTAHGLEHFLTEGLSLKQICDWAVFLKCNQDKVDWDLFYKWADVMHMREFANVMTAIACEYLGIEISNNKVCKESPFAERILEDAFDTTHRVHSKPYGNMRKRWENTKNVFRDSWKYSEVCGQSALVEYIRMLWGYLFERNPSV